MSATELSKFNVFFFSNIFICRFIPEFQWVWTWRLQFRTFFRSGTGSGHMTSSTPQTNVTDVHSISASAGICVQFNKGHKGCFLIKYQIIKRILAQFSLHTGLGLPVCPSTGRQNRCIKSFCCCNESTIKKLNIFSVIQKESRVEVRIRWAHKINATSYKVFCLILLAIVLAPFAIISASCNLLQLAWLQAWAPGCRIQLL